MPNIAGLLGIGAPKRSSAPYTFLNTNDIYPSLIAVYDLQEGAGSFTTAASLSELQNRLPMSNISVLNNDTSNPISFVPNNETAHAIVILNRAAQDLADVSIRNWQVKNLGTGTISAGAIAITVWNE